MKKILTILALAVMLCLLCSAALADVGTVYGGQITYADFLANVKGSTFTVGDIAPITYADSDVETVKATAKHAEYANVTVHGTNSEGTIEVIFKVMFEDHKWSAYKTTVEPTCTGKGVSTRSCSICKKTETKEIAALGHKFDWKVTKKATCTEDGSKILACTVCGVESGEPVVIAKLGHSYKDYSGDKTKWVIVTAPFCVKETQACADNGKYNDQVCEHCGQKNPDVADKDLTLAVYQAYLTAKGGDGSKYDGHNWDEWVIGKYPATCALPQQDERWCKRCNKIVTRNTDKDGKPLPEKYEYLKLEPAGTLNCQYTGKVWYRCSNCKGNTHADIFINVTKLTTKDPKEFKDGAGKVSVIIAHDAVEDSVGPNKIWAKKTGETPYAVTPATPVKCGWETWTKMKCSVNGCTIALDDKKIADAKPHEYSDWEIKTEGEQPETRVWFRSCKNCTNVETRVQADKPHECEPGTHVWVPVDPTSVKCENDNLNTKLKCKNCDATTTDKYPLKHNWETVSVVTEATCKNEGSEVQKCKNCATVQIVKTSFAAHKIVKLEEVAATCAKDGKEAAYQCTVCEKYFSDEKGETEIAERKTIPATGKHDYKEEVVTEPKCNEVGKKLFTCKVCGSTKTEEIPATGKHTPEVIPAVAATCVDTGLTEGSKCSVCDTILKAQEVVPATGVHTWEEEVITAATCKKSGTVLKTCKVCGKTEKGTIPQLKHAYDEGVVTKEPTESEEGVKTFTCKLCGTSYTEVIPKVLGKTAYTAEMAYDEEDGFITGSIEHIEGTKPAEGKIWARVTVFSANGTYTVGTFEIVDGQIQGMATGDVVHISIEVTSSYNVAPGSFDTYGYTQWDPAK